MIDLGPSNIDWCEDNFAVTPYIAEFWNTTSCVLFSGLVTVLLVRNWDMYARDSRFLALWASACSIAVGSVWFHATLTRLSQFGDEIPMLWNNAAFFYVCSTPSDRRDVGKAAGLSGVALLMSVLSVVTRDIYWVFLAEYGVSMVAVMYMIVTRDQVYAKWTGYAHAGIILYGAGLTLWVLDQTMCWLVKPFHFHALWHILVATGTCLMIVSLHFTHVLRKDKRVCIMTQRLEIITTSL
jgi:alkaline ceramidase